MNRKIVFVQHLDRALPRNPERCRRSAAAIFWDEAVMLHRFGFEVVDQMLRDITDRDPPFGGKVVVLGGDFRQVLPVVHKGSPAQVRAACIRNLEFWPEVICRSNSRRASGSPEIKNINRSLTFCFVLEKGVKVLSSCYAARFSEIRSPLPGNLDPRCHMSYRDPALQDLHLRLVSPDPRPLTLI